MLEAVISMQNQDCCDLVIGVENGGFRSFVYGKICYNLGWFFSGLLPANVAGFSS